VQLPLLQVPQEIRSWYSVLNFFYKVTGAIKSYCVKILFVPKVVNVELGLLELSENVLGVRFF